MLIGNPAGPTLHRTANLLLPILLVGCANAQEPSICYGTTSRGYLANGWKLPEKGPNFAAYSFVGSLLGRTYVHSIVHSVVLNAYQEVHETLPRAVFVYGETGFEKGGEFEPHKTHRNGLSVDFMVPIRDGEMQSVPLPTSVLNRWGYDLEFDRAGKLDEFEIDFEAMAEHLYQLERAAKRHGIGISRVIFAPELQKRLHQTKRWQYLQEHLAFSEKPSWVRHDEHYHVDFDVPCEPAA